MSPFISFSDSNCFGLSGATDEADEFSDPWLPPNDLRSDPRLSRSPGKLVFSPISSASASVRLDFLLKPGVSMPSKFKNHNTKRDHNVAKDKFHREQGLLKAQKKPPQNRVRLHKRAQQRLYAMYYHLGWWMRPQCLQPQLYRREGFNHWDHKLNLWDNIS